MLRSRKFPSLGKVNFLRLVLLLSFAPVPFLGSATDGPRIVFLLAEREYRTNETVPAFFEQELKPLGFRATYVTAPSEGGKRNDLAGLEDALAKANLLFVSVRRRAPTLSQGKALQRWVAAGKPVVGIRTASHAFHLRGKPAPKGHALWESWDAEVIGGNYIGHHGANKKTWFRFEHAVKRHPVLSGLRATEEIPSGGSLYKVLPLAERAQVLAVGRAEDVEQVQPVAWTHAPASGNQVFYTSLGHVEDFRSPAFRRLLLNGIHWSLGLKPP